MESEYVDERFIGIPAGVRSDVRAYCCGREDCFRVPVVFDTWDQEFKCMRHWQLLTADSERIHANARKNMSTR